MIFVAVQHVFGGGVASTKTDQFPKDLSASAALLAVVQDSEMQNTAPDSTAIVPNDEATPRLVTVFKARATSIALRYLAASIRH